MTATFDDASRGRRRPWRRILIWVGRAMVLLALVLWCTADGSPVGHFASGPDRDRFMAAYSTAMAALPKPDQTRDIRTLPSEAADSDGDRRDADRGG